MRARDVSFMVEHRQPICKLAFERMLEPPDVLYGEDLGSNYQGQETMLSKHFVEQTAGRLAAKRDGLRRCYPTALTGAGRSADDVVVQPAEREHDLGVELRSGAAAKLGERVGRAQRSTVGTVGGHRGVGVADGDDPRG